METYDAQIPDSPSKNSYIGSYYQPPAKVTPTPGHLDLPARSVTTEPQMPIATINDEAVVNAIKNLQRKIRQMELENKETETNYQRLSHNVTHHKEGSSSRSVAHQPGPTGSAREEYLSKLQIVEARCKILEKQLNRMSKMVENGNKERKAVIEQQNQQPSSSEIRTQHEKLEKLETECFNLSRTQALAETKLASLEEKLLREERERLLVQEKADQLQKELDTNLQASAPITAEEQSTPKTKPTRVFFISSTIIIISRRWRLLLHKGDISCFLPQKTPLRCQGPSPSGPKPKKMPFVAGKSTSPSHSVHANVQGILHMMKHHQPWLCEQVSALHKSTGGVKKNLWKEFSSAAPNPSAEERNQADGSPGLLSDLLLALQDELGQMSFEHQELVEEIDATQRREDREDLKLELERLVTRMEEKGAQITKLRKHWKMFQNLTQGQRGHEGPVSRNNAFRPPPSPVNVRRKGKNSGPIQNNLRLLRETHRFRNNLKGDDVSWEA
ncbi:centrosomal protein CEP57L1 isoform X2 [Takifugu flavidus]|uniref:centrosomal protein CEP57L1 isoform X2 n=1 Tax=Takifugu flavidus TaxID=433684 RepID=UPI0025447108|nr:centrosomal protein CEP57L1 isoform X2 [Takifugu flavidus]